MDNIFIKHSVDYYGEYHSEQRFELNISSGLRKLGYNVLNNNNDNYKYLTYSES